MKLDEIERALSLKNRLALTDRWLSRSNGGKWDTKKGYFSTGPDAPRVCPVAKRRDEIASELKELGIEL